MKRIKMNLRHVAHENMWVPPTTEYCNKNGIGCVIIKSNQDMDIVQEAVKDDQMPFYIDG